MEDKMEGFEWLLYPLPFAAIGFIILTLIHLVMHIQAKRRQQKEMDQYYHDRFGMSREEADSKINALIKQKKGKDG